MNVDPNKPLVACITRLVPQKGIHLIEHAVRRTVELGECWLVCYGSLGMQCSGLC